MISLYPMSGHLKAPVLTRPKRRLDDEDVDHFFKKRLLDNFENLKIFEGSRSASPIPQQSLLEKTTITTANTNAGHDRNTVYIDSVDQFLKDNQDSSDLSSKPFKSADDVSRNTTKEIVIPEGLLKPLNEIFNQSGQSDNERFLDQKKREVIERIISRKKLQQKDIFGNTDKKILEMDLMLDEGEEFLEPEVQVSNEEIYYEAYIGRYWSLIKYYNPPMLIYWKLQNWVLEQKRNQFFNQADPETYRGGIKYRSPQIEELDDDGDDIILSDDDEQFIPSSGSTNRPNDINTRFSTSTPTHTKIRNDYGDYYGEDNYRCHFGEDNGYYYSSMGPGNDSTRNDYSFTNSDVLNQTLSFDTFSNDNVVDDEDDDEEMELD